MKHLLFLNSKQIYFFTGAQNELSLTDPLKSKSLKYFVLLFNFDFKKFKFALKNSSYI